MPAINLLFCTHTFNLLDESLVAYIIFVCPVYSWWVNLTVLSTERIVLFLFSKKSIDKCLNEAPSLFKLVTISWPASMSACFELYEMFLQSHRRESGAVSAQFERTGSHKQQHSGAGEYISAAATEPSECSGFLFCSKW